MSENAPTVNPQHLRYELMLRNLSELIAATRRDMRELWSTQQSRPHFDRAHLIDETQQQLNFLLNYRNEVEDAYATTQY